MDEIVGLLVVDTLLVDEKFDGADEPEHCERRVNVFEGQDGKTVEDEPMSYVILGDGSPVLQEVMILVNMAAKKVENDVAEHQGGESKGKSENSVL